MSMFMSTPTFMSTSNIYLYIYVYVYINGYVSVYV